MEVISAGELFFGFNQINARVFKPFELFIALSMYYLAMTTVWTMIQARIEASLGERKGKDKMPGMFERLTGTKIGAH
jgi:polar amino acid transport system permease protein